MKKNSWLLPFLIGMNVFPVLAQNPTSSPFPAFTHASVIDMTGAPPRTGMTGVITGNCIAVLGKR